MAERTENIENGRFKSEFGYELATYRWSVTDPKVVCSLYYFIFQKKFQFLLYLSHGYGEYAASKAYTMEFIGRIQNIGGAVYAHDHYGHGHSAKDQNMRCNFNFQQAAEDLKKRLLDVKINNPDIPLSAFQKQVYKSIYFVIILRT